MTFKIDGVDFSPYLTKYSAIDMEKVEITSRNTCRTLNGEMHIGRIATKINLTVTFKALTTEELQTVTNALSPEWIDITYDDPQIGLVTRIMHTSSIPSTFVVKAMDGTEFWSGLKILLEEM